MAVNASLGVNVAVDKRVPRLTLPGTAVLVADASKVKVDVLIVAAFIGWLKVAMMPGLVTETPVAPLAGATALTSSGGSAVVKVQAYCVARVAPFAAVAPVVIMAMYRVP